MQLTFAAVAPVFIQADVVRHTEVENSTLNNWVRYKHVVPQQLGRMRLFSFEDMLAVELMVKLTGMFRAEIGASATIARHAVADYLPKFPDDVADISGGGAWAGPASAERFTCDLIRDADGGLRSLVSADEVADSVTVVLPSRLLARRLLASIMAGDE